MASFFDFDEIFGGLIKNRKLKGKWNVKEIDEPSVKGYIIQGRFWSDQPLEPLDPFGPLTPWERRPVPQRPFRTPETLNEIREPFVDVFDEDESAKISILNYLVKKKMTYSLMSQKAWLK